MAIGQTVTTATRAGARPGLRLGVRWGELLLLPLLLFACCGPLLTTTDPDYWWHLRTGQFIFDTGTVPRVDDYSFTVTGQPWISHEWLTDLLIYLLQRQIGYVGVATLFGLMTALTVGLIYLTCRRRGAGLIGTALLCLWALIMMLPSLNARPQLVTMLLLAVFAFLLTCYQQGQRRVLWALPPLMALWVNLHGGYLIGIAFLGLTIAGAVGQRLLGQRTLPLRPLLAMTVLSALASLLTPHGLDALRYPLSYVGHENASLQFVAEWKSPDFHQAIFYPFAASLLLALALGLGGRPFRATETLWAAAVAFMALQSIRHIPLYAIVVIPLIAERLSMLDRDGITLPGRARDLLRFGAGVLAVLLPALLLLAEATLAGGSSGTLQLGHEPSSAGYPDGAVQYLRTNAPSGRLFNEYRWGGYLIDQLYPARRVFIDGRADPFGDTLVTRYHDAIQARPGWQQFLDSWQIDLVLVDKDGPLATAMRDDPAWQEVYAGDVERLFTRRTGAQALDAR